MRTLGPWQRNGSIVEHMNGSVGVPHANQIGLHLTYLQLTGCPIIFSVSITEVQGKTQESIAANHESASGQGSLLTLQVSHRPMNIWQCFLIFSSDGSSRHFGSGAYVLMYVRTYVRTNVRTYVRTFVRTYVRTYRAAWKQGKH